MSWSSSRAGGPADAARAYGLVVPGWLDRITPWMGIEGTSSPDAAQQPERELVSAQ